MDLTLYKVGASGRVALGDLAKDVEFYNAAKDDSGVVTLTPVRIVAATGKRAQEESATDAGDTSTGDGDIPWLSN